jgi:Zn-finger nucleic acid-binding protein
MTLQITQREGVEIDYCPECRGIWLDSGELDKIIDRSKSFDQQPSEHSRHKSHKKHKKKHFIEELFDIFD